MSNKQFWSLLAFKDGVVTVQERNILIGLYTLSDLKKIKDYYTIQAILNQGQPYNGGTPNASIDAFAAALNSYDNVYSHIANQEPVSSTGNTGGGNSFRNSGIILSPGDIIFNDSHFSDKRIIPAPVPQITTTTKDENGQDVEVTEDVIFTHALFRIYITDIYKPLPNEEK